MIKPRKPVSTTAAEQPCHSGNIMRQAANDYTPFFRADSSQVVHAEELRVQGL